MINRDIEDSYLPNVTQNITICLKKSDGPEILQYEQMKTCLWTGRNAITVAKDTTLISHIYDRQYDTHKSTHPIQWSMKTEHKDKITHEAPHRTRKIAYRDPNLKPVVNSVVPECVDPLVASAVLLLRTDLVHIQPMEHIHGYM